jgi:23S rRNA-/tRNA-specific pseudouridylate synthase
MYTILFRTFCNLERYTKHYIKSYNYIDVRLDRYISQKFNLSWNILQKHFRKNDIFIVRAGNSEKLKNPSEKLQLNDSVYISHVISKVAQKEVDFDDGDKKLLLDLYNRMNVFTCNDFIILDKMCNIASQGGSGLKFSIDSMVRLRNNNFKLVHRLDRYVTGLMVVGNDVGFVRRFGEDLKNSKVEKIYLNLCQDLPLYLKHMISQGKIHPSVSNIFKSCLSGIIRSNENCDRYIIEMTNGYYFVNLDNIAITKQLGKSIQLDEFEMIGKFKITHFIYYDRNARRYYTYDIDKIYNMNEKERQGFNKFLDNVANSYKSEEKVNQYECFTLCYYELISGKKHQIRKQFGRCFMTPIFNDEEYLFDKELSTHTYNKFYEEFTHNNEEDGLRKYKINNYMNSILLHSIQLSLPYRIENFKSRKSIQVNLDNNKTVIKLQDVPDNFKYLFKIFDLNDDKVNTLIKI